MLKVYFTIIRPILEYAVPVWQAIPEYLSHKIESVQRRALKIIKPGEESYDELLQLLNVEKVQARREKLCKQYMDKIKTPNHLLNALIPHPCNREHDYSFRNNNRNFYIFNNYQLLDGVEQNITICRWRADQLFADAAEANN